MPTLHILHTNDFHNHMSDGQAKVICRAKAGLENALLLDAGDAISAGNVGVRPGGEPILTRMTAVGYDAMTMGNREFHVADALLRAKIGKAEFPILCANVRWREDRGEALPVASSLERTLANGLRVGVFGLTVPMVTERMAARVVSAFLFDDPVSVARAQIAHLRPTVDVLVALTHIGLRQDEKLAAACPELDLIIGGHSHDTLPTPKVVNGVPIVQTGWFGHNFGHVTLEVEAGRVTHVAGELTPLKERAR
ncbi:MAG: metallophosphatase [Armatimonadota bacterium]|nr:metallophosphatase [Armatimonadota bacterium]